MKCKTKNPTLIDASKLAAQHPDTFKRPSREEIAGLGIGHLVKVAIDGSPMPERFWCEIMERRGDIFTGKVANDLVYTERHGIARNDLIQFHADNIYALYVGGEPTHSGAII